MNKIKTIVLAAITVIICFMSTLSFPWNEAINNTFIDLQFKLRGSRQISDNLLVVFIGDEDIKSLNGWPITRDYYSYALHILNSKGAKVIALDILFAYKDKYHPEFDQTLIDFTGSRGNVCLPLAFSELVPGFSLFDGVNPTYPIEELRKSAAGLGFSNFAKTENVRSVPLFVFSQNEIIPSFGAELARVFLDEEQIFQSKGNFIVMKEEFTNAINNKGQLKLNHFGSIENINSIGFVDLLQMYKDNPDSLDFEGKLVLITVSAAGVANFKSTPLNDVFLSSLVHLTVAENIIYKNYLTEIPLLLNLLILVLLITGTWLLTNLNKAGLIISPLIIIIVYWIAAMLFFSYSNLVLPLFYSSLAIIATSIAIHILNRNEKQKMDAVLKNMLQEQLDNKEDQLHQSKEKLNELNTKLQQESESKEEIQVQAEENRSTILKLEKELDDLKTYIVPEKIDSQPKFLNFIHAPDSKMREILGLVLKVSKDDIPILISGETGTGKELIARLIHNSSHRKNNPFVAVNCGALSETLLESELFGHEKGSFTGATSRRKGRFELADGGTIFLDEITETTPAFQARVLRVLQENTFERVGGEQTLEVDIRIIAATNRNMQKEIENNKFRSDLYYRLNAFEIELPALRERGEDIPLLAVHFLKKHKYESVISFSDQAMKILTSWHWPGNVRELENMVRRSALLAQGEKRDLIQEKDFPGEIKKVDLQYKEKNIHKPLEEQILEMLRSLKFSHSAITQTAKALGDRDRGTITEYLRGMCFQHYVENNFNVEDAAQIIAETNDASIIKKVETKLDDYLNRLREFMKSSDIDIDDSKKLPAPYKGLPKKYHHYLKEILNHLKNE